MEPVDRYSSMALVIGGFGGGFVTTLVLTRWMPLVSLNGRQALFLSTGGGILSAVGAWWVFSPSLGKNLQESLAQEKASLNQGIQLQEQLLADVKAGKISDEEVREKFVHAMSVFVKFQQNEALSEHQTKILCFTLAAAGIGWISTEVFCHYSQWKLPHALFLSAAGGVVSAGITYWGLRVVLRKIATPSNYHGRMKVWKEGQEPAQTTRQRYIDFLKVYIDLLKAAKSADETLERCSQTS